MDCGWPSSACRWDRLGAWGQGWRRLLLLLVHLLEVLLPSPHLRILQLLHVEGLPVGQELLPLILQLPVPIEYCHPCSGDPRANTFPLLYFLTNPAPHSGGSPHKSKSVRELPLPLPIFWLPTQLLMAMVLVWGLALADFSYKALHLSLIWKTFPVLLSIHVLFFLKNWLKTHHS